MKLSDALAHYLTGLSTNLNSHSHQELQRFGRWIGWERNIAELAPPEVARYSEEIVAAGGDTHGRLTPLKEFLAFLKRKGELSHSLAPHIKIPRASKIAFVKTSAANHAIPMTSHGHNLLTVELKELKGQREPIIEAIRNAAADKDFKENAPLDAAREHQGKVEARIRELEETIRRAVIADVQERKVGMGAQVGSTVILLNLDSHKKVKYFLVDTSESDPTNGKISVASPVGRAVVGHRTGDQIQVEAPKGVLHYQVTAVNR